MAITDTDAELLSMIAEGHSVRRACAALGIGRTKLYERLAAEDDFANQYARAMELRAEHYMDEIIEIADDSSQDTTTIGEENAEIETTNHEVIQRAKLRVDTRKWLMGKLAPKKYGDKVQNEHTGAGGGPIEQAVSISVTFHDPEKAG